MTIEGEVGVPAVVETEIKAIVGAGKEIIAIEAIVEIEKRAEEETGVLKFLKKTEDVLMTVAMRTNEVVVEHLKIMKEEAIIIVTEGEEEEVEEGEGEAVEEVEEEGEVEDAVVEEEVGEVDIIGLQI